MVSTRSMTKILLRQSKSSKKKSPKSRVNKKKISPPPKKNNTISVLQPPSVKQEYKYEPIDFDDAHICWMANKRKCPNGTYVYICLKPLGNNRFCRNDVCDHLGLYGGCKKHYQWDETIAIKSSSVQGVNL